MTFYYVILEKGRGYAVAHSWSGRRLDRSTSDTKMEGRNRSGYARLDQDDDMISMETPYNATQQPYQPPGQAAYPPQVAYGYQPPQDQSASSAQYPPPTVQGYPPQGYPPQTHDFPPAYPTLEQGPPPAHGYKPDQPAYGYEPQLANTTAVVAAQPVTATTTPVSPPEEDHSIVAVCALVFSVVTLMTCGVFVICLALSIPALILSIVAVCSRGQSQKKKAGISIGLNVATVVCTAVLMVYLVTVPIISNSIGPISTNDTGYVYCPSYYSSTYNTYCKPYSYSTQGSCNYYESSYNGYCPSSSTYRCPNYYSSTYNTYCSASGYSSCTYFPSSSCPSSAYRECPSYYSSTYSTRCVAYSSNTRSSTPCSYYASYTNTGYCPT